MRRKQQGAACRSRLEISAWRRAIEIAVNQGSLLSFIGSEHKVFILFSNGNPPEETSGGYGKTIYSFMEKATRGNSTILFGIHPHDRAKHNTACMFIHDMRLPGFRADIQAGSIALHIYKAHW
jgi:hypothetical protein